MKTIIVTIAVALSPLAALANAANAMGASIAAAINAAQEDKNKATKDADEAKDAANRYCQLRPEDAACGGQVSPAPANTDNSLNPHGVYTLNCPPGQKSTGGPPTSATCVPDDSAVSPGPATAGNGGEEEPAPGGDRVVLPKSAPTPSPRPTDDERVTADQRSKADRCRQEATQAANSCQQALSAISRLRSQVAALGNTSGESTASACRRMQEQAASIGSQMQTHQSQCVTNVNRCEATCADAVSSLGQLQTSSAYVTATGGRSTCAGNRASVSSMNVNIQQAHDAATRGQQCYRQATKGDDDKDRNADNGNTNNNNNPNTANNNNNPQNNGGGWQMPDFSSLMNADTTTTTTTYTQDAPQDCGNPAFAAQNPVCICRVNPQHSACGGGIASHSDLGTARKDLTPTSTTAGAASPDELRLGGEDPAARQASKTGRYQGHGGGGTGLPGAGGAPGAGAARGWSYGTPRADKPGAGGGSWGSGGRSGTGQAWSPSEGYAGRGGGARGAGAARGGSQVDLRRFLPDATGSQAREPANVGAIGLKHTNIFRTVRDRYGRKADSLDP